MKSESEASAFPDGAAGTLIVTMLTMTVVFMIVVIWAIVRLVLFYT